MSINDVVPPAAAAQGGDLKRRVISALVFVPVVLLAVWLGESAFLLLAAVTVVLAAYEWSRITCGPAWRIDAAVQAVTVLSAVAALAVSQAPSRVAVACGFVVLGCLISGLAGLAMGRPHWWRILGIPYLALGVGAIVWLRLQPDVGFLLIVWLLAVIWAMDTGAYFAGRRFGGPKLAPRASPNKTWSGLIGGMLAAASAGAGVAWMTGIGPVTLIAGVSALVGGWSQAGDITESAVKRRFGVKDMSNLIPGHGGILDRIDGLLFAAPALVLIVIWLLPAWR